MPDRNSDSSAGFTLIELMIGVAIVAILVSVAVFMYTKSAAKARIESEVGAMFSEIEQRMSQSMMNDDGYPDDMNDETAWFPTAPGGKDPYTISALPSTWEAINMAPPMNRLYCSYVVVAGTSGQDANLGTVIKTMGLTSAPGTSWYYMLAKCDADGNGTDFSYYARSSINNNLVKKDEGK